MVNTTESLAVQELLTRANVVAVFCFVHLKSINESLCYPFFV